jgi:hypothetical protein
MAVPLPVSLGLNLAWGLAPWRLFAGWWLIACSVLYLVGIVWVAPNYRVELASLVLVGAPFLALLSAGSLLLLIPKFGDVASGTGSGSPGISVTKLLRPRRNPRRNAAR